MDRLTPEERVRALEERLGLQLADPALALCALTHKSFTNEHRDFPGGDNERLEFLGDAVVDLAVSHRLMEQFPAASEGELSKMRALIVNEEGIARVARRIGLGDILLLGRGEDLTGGRAKNSVLADALEAVLGAVYVSAGMVTALALVDALFAEALAGVADGKSGQDYKTLLQESAQDQLKLSPRYRVVAEAGPDHEKVFEVEVTIGSEAYGRAAGRSKKEAEQAAARQTLERLASRDKK
jgi:ribonuclease III